MPSRRKFLALAGLTTAAAALAQPASAHHKPGHNHGPATTSTEPATTTTLVAPTTTAEPMPTTTSITITPGNVLTWPPPAGWESFQTQAVPTSGGTINLTAGQDYRLIMPASPVNKRIRVVGGRHVVVIGGEINIDTDWATDDDQNALWFDSQTGTIHVEGIWAHGAFINDGVKGSAGAAVWQVQQCRLDELQGTQAGYHCDGFQPFGGFQALRIDLVTVYSQFQGLMMNADANRWLTTDLRRVNFGQYLTPDSTARTFNLISGTNPDGFPRLEGPVHFGGDCYLQARTTSITSSIAPAAWFTVSGSGASEVASPNPDGWSGTNPGLQMDGQIKEGLPPGGEYVPAPSSGGNVGLAYVSPGYRS